MAKAPLGVELKASNAKIERICHAEFLLCYVEIADIKTELCQPVPDLAIKNSIFVASVIERIVCSQERNLIPWQIHLKCSLRSKSIIQPRIYLDRSSTAMPMIISFAIN